MSKYLTLPNSELIPSKMAKLQGLENTYYDVILSLQNLNFLS